ncbi:rhoptry neck protein 2, putative [Eimeria mitis]|uniref:Rhoptry neck protein 2, putative n=1 Tax=Eimeria mitis TaxID=44415 RepID=U6K326_9EIME|nr:rhoptry neck protein 2, putative [Eimeria mitis]CDJ32084.1 rhoptry neck protein 2, putative [Eimeria mitis]
MGASMSFPGASGSYGGFSITHSADIRSGEVPILQQERVVTGAAGVAAAFEHITPQFAAPPVSKSQIIYGWVPDPEATTTSLEALNAAELNNALRSAAFVNKLRSTLNLHVSVVVAA